MGFTLIGLEMLLLLAFQAIYGYVYHQLAIVIAAFMVGMALGSWWGLLQAPTGAAGRSSAGKCDVSRYYRRLRRYLRSCCICCFVSSPLSRTSLASSSPARSFSPLWPCAAASGRTSIPLGQPDLLCRFDSTKRGPGTLYALDLVGACMGAVLFSVYLVPVFGFLKTALLMAMVNLAPAVLASLSVSEAASVPE